MRDKIQKSIKDDLEIPPLPQAVLQVQTLVEDPSTTARDLAAVISSDATLTARLLKQANSKFYGYSKSIGTVPLAIVVLGFDTVREIALGITTLRLADSAFEQSLLDPERFWSHSLAVAAGSRIIAQKWRIGLAGEAFVVGLMHDLGRLLLASYWSNKYKEVINEARSNSRHQYEVENEMLGTNHAEVTSWLLERWKLPEQMVIAAKQVHQPLEEQTIDLSKCVILANWLAHRSGFRHDSDAPYLPEPQHIIKTLPGYEEIELRNQIKELYRQATGLLDILKSRSF
ncbi:MAG: HDOD domain-containing protein [Candidatus Electryonea clarkiae]|nr:HDOD domain-containing protein [Candidatus Electryonea clarkiae]MDP8288055.1 HDOD domain-containing protein [Candidatus Electryonea clarkiae]